MNEKQTTVEEETRECMMVFLKMVKSSRWQIIGLSLNYQTRLNSLDEWIR